MRLGIPTSEGETRLSGLVLKILSENLTSPRVGNIRGIIIIIQEMFIVEKSLLVVGGEVIIVRIVVFQTVFLSLFEQIRMLSSS